MENTSHNVFDEDTAEVLRFKRGEKGSIWAEFAKAETAEEFCRLWLSIQCSMFQNIKGALILLGKENVGPFVPVALWPDVKRNMQYLAPVAERALIERRSYVVEGSDQGYDSHYFAYPIEINGKLYGVVVIDVLIKENKFLRSIIRQIQWGSAWLELMFLRKDSLKDVSLQKRLITSFDLISTIIENRGFSGSATAFVTEMATQLECERVSLGLIKRKNIVLKAMSNTAEFGKKMNLAQKICEAMEETIDQRAVIYFPEKSEDILVNRAHKQLSNLSGTYAVYSFPLSYGDDLIGCLTIEFSEDNFKFDETDIEMCEGLLALAGPMLYIQHQEERWLISKITESLKHQIGKVFGPNHPGLKLIVVTITFLLIFLTFFEKEYRITSKASLEGVVQRSIAAPFDGYIKKAMVRAGDLVAKGDPITILDDRDLSIERTKNISEKQQLLKKFREAMAKHEFAQVRILKAQIGKIEAQLQLINEQLSRTKIMAPFDGIVISGDLSQSLGAPVERGKILFEVAPLNDYRIILKVDEHEICDVKVGQNGKLVLTAIPNETFAFRVKKITPVSIAEEGKNYFRVEASISNVTDRLRPGMEGIGKISVDHRKLIWIWTHKSIDWVRLKLWSIWP